MGRKFMANHLPPLPPRDYVRAQQTGRPVGDFVPGGPLRPDQMIPPHVSADKMVRRLGRAQMQTGRPVCERAADWRPTIQRPKSAPTRPSTEQASSSTASDQAWSESHYDTPWTNADWNSWQEWSSTAWQADAARGRQRPVRPDRGPYAKGKGKGKKGKKGKGEPAS